MLLQSVILKLDRQPKTTEEKNLSFQVDPALLLKTHNQDNP